MDKIFVVIPNWNGADWISECLDSLLHQSQEHTVVVVDNGSVDNSVLLIEQDHPQVHLIKLPHNTGFAGGVNAGIAYALKQDAYAIALFNNDAVAGEKWLEKLVRTMQSKPEVGIVTGKLMRSDKQHIDSTGDCYSIWGMPLPRGRNQIDKGQFDTPEPVFSASGGASIYRSKLFDEIGLFDERFFAYYEDVDISFRARLAGWDIWYQPEAVAYHRVSATSSRLGSFNRYHATKNFYMLWLKNMPLPLAIKYFPLFVLQAVRLAVSSVLRGGCWPYLRGIGRFIYYFPGILRSRWHIQRKLKVGAGAIDSLLYRHRPPKIPVL